MKKKIIVSVFVVCSTFYSSYGMFGRGLPTNLSNFNSGKVTAPKFGKFDVGPDSTTSQGPKVEKFDQSGQSYNQNSSTPLSQSVAAITGDAPKPLVDTPVQSLQSNWMLPGSLQQVKSPSVLQSLGFFDKPVAKIQPASVVKNIDLPVVQDVVVVEPASQPAQSTNTPRPNLFASIAGSPRALTSVSKNQSEVTAARDVSGMQTFETLDAYTKALHQVEVAAETQALKEVNRKATQEFNKQWPAVLEQYTATRKALGQQVVDDRINLLKDQTKNNITRDVTKQNQATVDAAVQKAVEDFTKQAIKPERKVRQAAAGGRAVALAPKVTESSVRSQAENQMRSSIIDPKIKDLFTPDFESAWLQDFALDYEIKNHAQASSKVIEAAKKEYVDTLRLKITNELTPQDKALIKQAGQDAITQWKLQQDAIKTTNFVGNVSVEPVASNVAPVIKISGAKTTDFNPVVIKSDVTSLRADTNSYFNQQLLNESNVNSVVAGA